MTLLRLPVQLPDEVCLHATGRLETLVTDTAGSHPPPATIAASRHVPLRPHAARDRGCGRCNSEDRRQQVGIFSKFRQVSEITKDRRIIPGAFRASPDPITSDQSDQVLAGRRGARAARVGPLHPSLSVLDTCLNLTRSLTAQPQMVAGELNNSGTPPQVARPGPSLVSAADRGRGVE